MKIYTPEEAEAMTPSILRQIALGSIRAMMLLDKYPVNSRMFENEVMTLQGYLSYLMKLVHTVWRAPHKKKSRA